MSLADRVTRLEEKIAPSRVTVVHVTMLDGSVMELVMGGTAPGRWHVAKDGTRTPWADHVRQTRPPSSWAMHGVSLPLKVDGATANVVTPDDDAPALPRPSWTDGR